MATDNRHRPGPPFRCPDCGAFYPRLVTLFESPDVLPSGVMVRCASPTCRREWRSRHRAARELARAYRKLRGTAT
jgi:hypothetical protein